MGRIFDGTFDIGGRNLPFDDGDQASIERMMGQHDIFLRFGVRSRLRFG
jgi:hypothetical protein